MGNDPGQSTFESDITQNVANPSMQFMMYSAVFGNNAFAVQPASKGEVQQGFNTVPYMSVEALLYNAAMSNPIVAPTNVQTGSYSGTQNVSGSITNTDSDGNVRVAISSSGQF